MGRFCGRCGHEIPEGTSRCAACGYDPTMPEVLSQVGDIGIRCRKYGLTDGRLTLQADNDMRIANGQECFNKTVWTSVEFGAGPDLGKPRDFDFYCTFRGRVGKMSLPVDMSEIEVPYRVGAMITSDLMLHFYIGSENDNLEYVCKFLPDEMYS